MEKTEMQRRRDADLAFWVENTLVGNRSKWRVTYGDPTWEDFKPRKTKCGHGYTKACHERT